MVACFVRDEEAAGSNPATPTPVKVSTLTGFVLPAKRASCATQPRRKPACVSELGPRNVAADAVRGKTKPEGICRFG